MKWKTFDFKHVTQILNPKMEQKESLLCRSTFNESDQLSSPSSKEGRIDDVLAASSTVYTMGKINLRCYALSVLANLTFFMEMKLNPTRETSSTLS